MSLRRLVGGHACVGASESDSPEQKKKISWQETAQQKLLLIAADFVVLTSYARGLETNREASLEAREDIWTEGFHLGERESGNGGGVGQASKARLERGGNF